jgi:hypothetical protein
MAGRGLFGTTNPNEKLGPNSGSDAHTAAAADTVAAAGSGCDYGVGIYTNSSKGTGKGGGLFGCSVGADAAHNAAGAVVSQWHIRKRRSWSIRLT